MTTPDRLAERLRTLAEPLSMRQAEWCEHIPVSAGDGEALEAAAAMVKAADFIESLATPVPGAVSNAMVLDVALDFADNPRPHHTLQAPADTNGELYSALAVLAAAYRAALEAAVQSPPIVGVRGSNHSLSFEDGLFTIKADGSGEISFKDDALDWGDGEDHDWRSQKLHASEVSAIRDWLNRSTSAPPLAAPVEAALDDNGEIDLRDCLFWLENTEGFGNLDEVHTLATFVRRHISAAPVEAVATEPVAVECRCFTCRAYRSGHGSIAAVFKAHPVIAPTGDSVVTEPVADEYPLAARIWKRRNEWVLSLSGTINDTFFESRHTEPLTTAPEDVAGLPSLYAAPTGDSGALREALALARDTLDEAEEELRMIRMKDSAAVYNTTLRSLGFGLARQKIDAALKGEPGK
jgi:hypothetical protein